MVFLVTFTDGMTARIAIDSKTLRNGDHVAHAVAAERKQAKLLCSAATPHGRQMPAKAKGGRVSSRANQCGTLGLESVHSHKDVAGTRQRYSVFSQLRQ